MNLSDMRVCYKQNWPMADTDPTQDTGDPTNTVINADLHAAARYFYDMIKATMPERLVATKTFTITTGGETVDLTSGSPSQVMAKITQVRTRPTGSVADPNQLRAVRRSAFVNLPVNGMPEVYARHADTLLLRPAPLSSYDVIVDYIPEYTLITDSVGPAWLPVGHHEIIPYRAVLVRKRILGDNVAGIEATLKEMQSNLVQDLEESIPDTGVNLDDALGDYYE